MVDVQSHQVLKDGIPVNLKPMEYDLFVLLLQNKNIALGREELLKRVWGDVYKRQAKTPRKRIKTKRFPRSPIWDCCPP